VLYAFHITNRVWGVFSPEDAGVGCTFPSPATNLFDKTKFEELLVKLQSHREQVFGELPVHYETVGHFLQTDPDKHSVDVLLDFK